MTEAKTANVRLFTRRGVESACARADGFDLNFAGRKPTTCNRLLLATGGSRSVSGAQIAQSLGHTLTPAVPSLFSFHVATPWLRLLPGVSVQNVETSVPRTRLRERGALLITHHGVSGPAILRLSAWGARVLHGLDYDFTLRVNWLPDLSEEQIRSRLQSLRESHPNRHITKSPIVPLSVRLWEQLAIAAGVRPETRWTALSRTNTSALASLLARTEFEVKGKSLNKEEFVTCGGVNLREVNFMTMESRIVPGLYFAGELLDIDGITGGFNFQAAWTTGWIAGHAMAQVSR
jgi:predicted Rossmann fold flavoprotein